MAITIKILILFVTTIYLIFRHKNRLLLLILILASANIIITDIFLHYKIPHQLNNSIYVIISNYLWFLVLSPFIKKKLFNFFNLMFLVILVYQTYSANIMTTFYNDYFIFTAFLYVIGFSLVIYDKLKNEKLEFFKSDMFYLVSAPVIFFTGKCLIFAFKSRFFSETVVFGNVTAWRLVNFIVNIILYTIILIYILKSKEDNKWKR